MDASGSSQTMARGCIQANQLPQVKLKVALTHYQNKLNLKLIKNFV
jgi:hypothetical protein